MHPSRRSTLPLYTTALLVLAALLVGCTSGPSSNGSNPTLTAPTNPAASSPAHWGYEGENGPDQWAGLDPKYTLCASGKQQSPVDIANTVRSDISDVFFSYQPAKLNIVNNGHTIEVDYPAGDSLIKIDEVDYKLAQFHFHTPSEHTINGKQAAMELHFVNKSADGNLAVVGVLINEGLENKDLAAIWAHLPTHEGDTAVLDADFNVAVVLPRDQRTYRYDGSLTTPPCTEGVKWRVMETPIEMSKAQIDAFKAIFPQDARPVQSANGRKIDEDVSANTR